MRLTYLRTDGPAKGGAVVLTEEALSVINDYRQTRDTDMEAGGVLLGRYITGAFHVIVDAATSPLPGDERGRHSFYRDAKAHQDIINQRWQESGGTCCYLGEWHTHPEQNPQPSAIDINDWQQRMRKDYLDAEGQVFVIAGIDSIGVWEGDRSTGIIRQLSLRADE